MDLLAASTSLRSVALVLALASAAMFALVARTVAGREVSKDSRPARDAFVLWWSCLGFVTILNAVLALPGFPSSLALYLTANLLSLAALCVGLWGLLYYLASLYTARKGLGRPLAVAYAAYFVFLVYFIFAGRPDGLESTSWGLKLHYADPIESGPVYWTAIILLIAPPFLAAAGYLSLYWKVDDPVLRRRILLVSVSILVWFGSALVGTGLGESSADWWRLVSRLIGLAAAGTIYYAYRGMKPSKPHSAHPSKPTADDVPLFEAPRKGATHILPRLA